MKARILFLLSAGVLLCAAPASAQSGAADAGPVSRFGVAFRAGFNITASFKNLGGYGPTGSPGTTNGWTARINKQGVDDDFSVVLLCASRSA